MIVGLAIIIVILDQATKALVVALSDKLPFDVIPGVFTINLTYNTGGAFSMLKGHSLFFIITAIVSIGMIIYLIRIIDQPKYFKLALSLILGGAIGNLIDRVRVGSVIDFLDFHIWPVFNIADSAITIGAFIIIIIFLKGNKGKAKEG